MTALAAAVTLPLVVALCLPLAAPVLLGVLVLAQMERIAAQ